LKRWVGFGSFREKITVIKLGGSVMEDADSLRAFAGRHRVHGNGRHAADRGAWRAGRRLPGQWRRLRSSRDLFMGVGYTDDATLKIVERVLAGEINENIAARIEELGGRAMPLNFAGGTEQQRAVRRTA